MVNVLLVEDDLTFSKILEAFLSKSGYKTDVRHDVKTGLQALAQNTYSLLLLDYRLPDGTGLDILAAAQSGSNNLPVIMMTSFNDVRTAVKAMRSGVFEYITKPVNPEELLMVMHEALHKQEHRYTAVPAASGMIEGKSTLAQKLWGHIQLVGPTDMTVLVMGESGTGKEHVARSIHAASKRKNKPFAAIDCGTLSRELAASELFGYVKGAFTGAMNDKKGLLENANGGTVFLDEIGNLGYDVQVKLLRVLQERVIQPVGSNKQIAVDIRLVAATNEDLGGAIAKGQFREDIYHRINEFKIQVPPLRERGEDLDLFIAHFIAQANAELDRNVKTVSPQVNALLHQYDWPGNLRELKNVVKRMVLLTHGTTAGIETMPDEMVMTIQQQPQKHTTDLKSFNEAGEKDLILKALAEAKNNKSKAARLLNIDRKTLYLKMERYGIS